MFDIERACGITAPLLLVVMGVNKMIGYPTVKDFTSRPVAGLHRACGCFAVFDNLSTA